MVPRWPCLDVPWDHPQICLEYAYGTIPLVCCQCAQPVFMYVMTAVKEVIHIGQISLQPYPHQSLSIVLGRFWMKP